MTSRSHLLLHGEELDDVLVVQFFQHLKLPHLDVQRPQEAQVIEHFDSVEITGFLQRDLKSCYKVYSYYY